VDLTVDTLLAGLLDIAFNNKDVAVLVALRVIVARILAAIPIVSRVTLDLAIRTNHKRSLRAFFTELNQGTCLCPFNDIGAAQGERDIWRICHGYDINAQRSLVASGLAV